MYCIIVKTELKQGTRDHFLSAMSKNATASVREEPGCIAFDVLSDREDPNTFYLYEIYTDLDALQAHKATRHYQETRAAVNEWINRQSVIRCDVVALNPQHR